MLTAIKRAACQLHDRHVYRHGHNASHFVYLLVFMFERSTVGLVLGGVLVGFAVIDWIAEGEVG